jgi:hypothetical protein
VYDEYVKRYLEKVLPVFPDTIIARTDRMLERTRSNPEVFQHLASLLLNYYRNNSYVMAENVWVHMAEKWFIPLAGEWKDSLMIADLSKEVSDRKLSRIGQQAPDMQLMTYSCKDFTGFKKGDSMPEGKPASLKELFTAKINILFFWEAGCIHCLEAVPQLQEQLKDFDSSKVKIIGILTSDYPEGVEKWAVFLNTPELCNWTHARSPGSSRYKWDYRILTTPALYILDENGQILIKNIEIEQTKDIVNMFLSL